MSEQTSPNVYVLAGPNGAGKTTFSSEFLPDFVHCREFLNADLIAAGLSPFAPETQAMRAGRLQLTRIKELVHKGHNFAFETTLSGRGYVRLLKQMKIKGYRVALFFLWLPSAETACERVHSRVAQGGHNIPVEIIIRRYHSGLKNLFTLYRPIVDILQIYNAATLPPKLLLHEADQQTKFFDKNLFNTIRRQAGA